MLVPFVENRPGNVERRKLLRGVNAAAVTMA